MLPVWHMSHFLSWILPLNDYDMFKYFLKAKCSRIITITGAEGDGGIEKNTNSEEKYDERRKKMEKRSKIISMMENQFNSRPLIFGIILPSIHPLRVLRVTVEHWIQI